MHVCLHTCKIIIKTFSDMVKLIDEFGIILNYFKRNLIESTTNLNETVISLIQNKIDVIFKDCFSDFFLKLSWYF